MTAPIAPIAALTGADATQATPIVKTHGVQSFYGLLSNGLDHVNQKLVDADTKARAFILDDTIPPHQVIFAMEEARSSFEMAMQVRAKLVEGYQELMRMQL